MNRRGLFQALAGTIIIPAVTERVRAYSFVGGWRGMSDLERALASANMLASAFDRHVALCRELFG